MGAIHAVAIVLAGLATACSTIVDVSVDDAVDVARYRTWSWQSRAHGVVDAPKARSALASHLDRAIARELTARGYERVTRDAELRVTYHLSLQPRAEMVAVARAPYLLSSLSSSPSYWIEGTDVEEKTYHALRLGVDIADAGGRVIWSSALKQKLEKRQHFSVNESVVKLLERFPERRPVEQP